MVKDERPKVRQGVVNLMDNECQKQTRVQPVRDWLETPSDRSFDSNIDGAFVSALSGNERGLMLHRKVLNDPVVARRSCHNHRSNGNAHWALNLSYCYLELLGL